MSNAQDHSAASRKSVYLVLACTLFSAAAQVLLKFGAGHPLPVIQLSDPATAVRFVLAILGNYYLFGGYCMSAGTAFLLILALRHGELSRLYPIIAMSYVWVNLLSMYFFNEKMNVWKVGGIVLVISGVALLGRGADAGGRPEHALEMVTAPVPAPPIDVVSEQV